MMVGEDMSEFLNHARLLCACGRVGPGRAAPTLRIIIVADFDEHMLPTGVALLAGAALSWLNQQHTGRV